MAAAALTITSLRNEVVDFSYPFWNEDVSVVFMVSNNA